MGAALLPKMLADSVDRNSAFLYLFLNLLGTQRNPSLSNVFKMDGQQADPRRTGGRRAHPAPFILQLFGSLSVRIKMVRDVPDPAAGGPF